MNIVQHFFHLVLCLGTKRKGMIITMITKKEIKDRFERTSGGILSGVEIITDKNTGVQYMVVNKDSDGCGITPLIDKNGKPLLAKPDSESHFDLY